MRGLSGNKALTWLIAALVAVCGAFGVYKLGRANAPGAAGNTVVTNGATPPATPTPTLAAPFLGTPAQGYADGSAGIVIPQAKAVGSYSAAEVAAAYGTTKKMLIAAYLNVPTLNGGAPDAFAGLLTSRQRNLFVTGLDKIGLDANGQAKSTRTWVMAFPPGTTQLVGNVIKVHGTMLARAAKDDGFAVLRVRADYLYVYAVAEPGRPGSLTRIVSHQVVSVDFAPWDDLAGALEPWWNFAGFVAGAQCGTEDGYQHPQFSNGPAGKVRPSGTPVNPYDENAPPTAKCQATTGT